MKRLSGVWPFAAVDRQDAWLLAIDPVAELCYTLFQRGLATGCDSMKECLMVAPVARVEEL